jgi:hypothetical protein
MRYISFVLVLMLVLGACNSGTQVKEKQNTDTTVSTGVYGRAFPVDNAVDANLLPTLFTETNKIEIKLRGLVVESCQHSGCWMNIDIGDGEVLQVLFKDGDFTIPLESAGKKAIINGIAYRELVEVDELKAMAREEGKPDSEINLIIEPVWEYSFVAEGVIFE